MTSSAPVPGPEFLALQEAVAGRFSLVRELGRGGMGVVFLARDLALDRLVAIKLLPPDLASAPDARERFLREARTAAGLAHPNIVPVHSVESTDGLAFFVMGFVDGETLGERVRRHGPLPPAEAIRVVQEVAWALAHGHARGVVHRDVKPDNVLIERGTGRALVTDFGIAHALGSETPREGVVRGTPQYVSPEVAMGAAGDARSDVYSLGVTAWMAAAGRLPFDGASAAAILLAHVQSPAPTLVGIGRVPTRFARAVDRCLAKEPEARWPGAEAFAAELDAVRARPPQVAAPARAFLREWESAGDEVITASTASFVAITEALVLTVLEQVSSGPLQFDLGIIKWIFAIIAVLTAGLAKARLFPLITHARAVMRAGFDHARIIRAQALDLADRADERLAVADARLAERRGLRSIVGGTILGSVLSFAAVFSDVTGWLNVAGAAGAVILPTLAIRTIRRLRVRDDARAPWNQALRGPLGRWIFRLAGAGQQPVVAHGALEGPEPTAIAVGAGARELLASLPAGVRGQLGPGVPALIDALEANALASREPAVAGTSAPGFAESLGALEALRLDLLRLSVGTLTAPQLTAELERVRDIGAAVDRHLAARDDVEALLERERTPR